MVDVRTNLLKNRRTLSEKEYQREKTYFQWSIVGMVVVIVVVVAISVWNLILTTKLAKIEESFTATSREMQGLSEASAQQVYLKGRLNLITGFLADRSLTREALQKIFSTEIAGTHVGGASFDEENKLVVQYVSDDVRALRELVSLYEADTSFFLEVVSKGLSHSKDGSYQLSLLMTLPKGGK